MEYKCGEALLWTFCHDILSALVHQKCNYILIVGKYPCSEFPFIWHYFRSKITLPSLQERIQIVTHNPDTIYHPLKSIRCDCGSIIDMAPKMRTISAILIGEVGEENPREILGSLKGSLSSFYNGNHIHIPLNGKMLNILVIELGGWYEEIIHQVLDFLIAEMLGNTSFHLYRNEFKEEDGKT